MRRFSGALRLADPDLGCWLDDASERELAELRKEFARLFVLPGGVSPQASAGLEGERESDAERIATLAHRAMQALELDQTRIAGHLMLDRLGLL